LTGGRWRGLFLDADQNGNWRVLCKTRGNSKPGESISLSDRNGTHRLTVKLVTRLDDGSWVVHPESDDAWLENLKSVGHVPLPNYIRGGNMIDSDVRDYQTVFAKHLGSIAAPTAGMHLTESLLRRLIDRGVKIAQVTLHIGIGTIGSVKTVCLDDHEMLAERGKIDDRSVKIISRCMANGGRIIAVGGSTARVLETASLTGRLEPWQGETNLFIRPTHEFKAIDALLTNFHPTRSTPLIQAHTFGGNRLISEAYQAAIEERYRFFSYGDAMLIT
jgi:S-adenosylmethionine:tRNA ribosyltransferase-isomerase